MKSDKASSDAQSTSASAANKASDAKNGNVHDARRAKKEARRSLKDAKDSRRADSNLSDENKKLTRLNEDMLKNQNRLKELDAMRSSIMGQ